VFLNATRDMSFKDTKKLYVEDLGWIIIVACGRVASRVKESSPTWIARRPECIGLIWNSKVNGWLWLGKVLAPLAHFTWSKLHCVI
jgi:hypothetical protein